MNIGSTHNAKFMGCAAGEVPWIFLLGILASMLVMIENHFPNQETNG